MIHLFLLFCPLLDFETRIYRSKTLGVSIKVWVCVEEVIAIFLIVITFLDRCRCWLEVVPCLIAIIKMTILIKKKKSKKIYSVPKCRSIYSRSFDSLAFVVVINEQTPWLVLIIIISIIIIIMV